jgi:hypothetical protein
MKADNKRHYDLKLSKATIIGKYVFSRQFRTKVDDKLASDTQELARLNQLASRPPFCAWQRQRNYDPL